LALVVEKLNPRRDPADIGPFKLLARLGVGGFGTVYAARRWNAPEDGLTLEDLVAVKVVHPHLADEPAFRARFKKEIAAIERVHCPFVPQLVDAGAEEDPPWLATNLIPGLSLDKVVRARGPLPERAVWHLAAALAEILSSIHAADVVHRDFKPQNVLLEPTGPWVIDFSLVHLAELDHQSSSQVAMATYKYAAPEQLHALRDAERPADVYALGATLLFAATGHPPFDAPNLAQVIQCVLNEKPDLSGLPASLHSLVAGCLQRSPQQRPTLDQMLKEVGRHTGGSRRDWFPGVLPWQVVTLLSAGHAEVRSLTGDTIPRALSQLEYKKWLAASSDETLAASLAFFEDMSAEDGARTWRVLTLPSRLKLLKPLLETNDPRATKVLRAQWDALADDIITLANRRLDAAEADWAVRALGIAGTRPAPEADVLLMKLIVPPADPDPAWQSALGARSDLLRGRVAPEVGTYEMTCAVLRGSSAWQERIVLDLLYGLIAEESGTEIASRWASWLCLSPVDASLPAWGEALRYALNSGNGHRASRAVRFPARGDTRWAVVVVMVAAHTGHLPRVLAVPGLARALLTLALTVWRQSDQDGNRRVLRRALEDRLRTEGLDARTLATVDATRMLLGIPPRDFPLDGREATPYIDTLVRILHDPRMHDLYPDLKWELLDWLLGRYTGQDVSVGTLLFLRALPADQALARYVAQPDITRKLLACRELDRDFWSALAVLHPDLKRTATFSPLVHAVRQTIDETASALDRRLVTDAETEKRGLSGTVLAHAMHDAIRGGMKVEGVLEVLASSADNGGTLAQSLQPGVIESVLRELQNLLHFQPASDIEGQPTGAEDILFHLQDEICVGVLGEEYGHTFRQILIDRLEAERDIRAARIRELRRQDSRRRRRSRGGQP
jgi:serine/threonine protein kinase